MTKTDFLNAFTEFTKEVVKDVILPCAVQSAREIPVYRAPDVYKMRLPDMNSTARRVPYIINQIVTSDDVQKTKNRTTSKLALRTVICVYGENDEDGAISLVELTERIRIALLKRRIIAKKYELDIESNPLEVLLYPDDTSPYFAAEMLTYWNLPSIEREDALAVISGNLPYGT